MPDRATVMAVSMVTAAGLRVAVLPDVRKTSESARHDGRDGEKSDRVGCTKINFRSARATTAWSPSIVAWGSSRRTEISMGKWIATMPQP